MSQPPPQQTDSAKRKRSSPVPAREDVKRLKSDAGAQSAQGGPGDTVALLTFQKTAMMKRLMVRKRQNDVLQKRVYHLEKEYETYKRTLVLVHDHWNQLNQDLQLILQRLPAIKPRYLEESSGLKKSSSKLLDLFSGGEDGEEKDSVEKQLRERCTFTKNVLRAVVESLEEQACANQQLNVLVRQQSNGAEGEGEDSLIRTLTTNNNALAEANRALQSTVESLHIKIKEVSLEAQAAQAEKESLSERLESQNEFLETQRVETAALNRRCDRLELESKQAKEAAATAIATPVVAAGAEPAPELPQVSELVEELKEELEVVKNDVQRRMNENAELRERLDKMRRELIEQETRPASDEAVRKSGLFAALLVRREMEIDTANAQMRRLQIANGRSQEEVKKFAEQLQQLRTSQEALFKQTALKHEKEIKEIRGKFFQRSVQTDKPELEELKKKDNLCVVFKNVVAQQNTEMRRLREQLKRQTLPQDAKVLEGKHALLTALQTREAEWKKKVEKLQLMVSAAGAGAEEMEKAADYKLLQQKCEELKRRLEVFEGALVRTPRRSLSAEESVGLQVTLRETQAELQKKVGELASQAEVVDMVGSELDDLAANYTQQQDKVAELLETLRTERTTHTEFAMERSRWKRAENLRDIEAQKINSKLYTMEERRKAQDELISKLRENIASLEATIPKLEQAIMRERERGAAFLASSKNESARCAKALAEKEATRKANEATVAKLLQGERERDAERAEFNTLKEHARSLERKLERRKKRRDGEGVNEELEVLRHQIQCSVCHDEPKSCIISKCYHMFCRPCVEHRIKIRLRKCPQCGNPFDAKDIKAIFF